MGLGRERAHKAIKSMEAMGFKSSIVIPVLKKLLNTCEKNWEHIEAENYRLLIEAIFEDDTPEAEGPKVVSRNEELAYDTNGSKGGSDAKEVSEFRRKRQRQEDACSSSTLTTKALHKTRNLGNKGAMPISNLERNHEAPSTSTPSVGPSSTKNPLHHTMELVVVGSSMGKVEREKSLNELIMCKPLSIEIPVPNIHQSLAVSTSEDDTRKRKGKAIVRFQEPSSDTCSTPSSNRPSCRLAHDISDISRGEEKIKIPVVNEFPGERCPPHFNYISESINYQDAYVNFSLARIGDDDCCEGCFGDCLSASLPCACARETGGEFAYTPRGLLKNAFLEECIAMRINPPENRIVYCKDCPLERAKDDVCPDECKGHLVRRFIKECWKKCGCHAWCGNRVVQRGIQYNLQVFWTPSGKGWGVRSTKDIPRGAFVCEYVGEVLTNMELYERTMKKTKNARHTYPVLLDADWGTEGVLKDEEALCLDGTFFGNVARFINHRCYDANLVDVPVEIETPDRHYHHLAFFTSRKVDAFEELTWDYGIDFDDHEHLVKAFQCHCGSNGCRDKSHANGARSVGIKIR